MGHISNPIGLRLFFSRYTFFVFVMFQRFLYAHAYYRDIFLLDFLNFFNKVFRKKKFNNNFVYFLFRKYSLFFPTKNNNKKKKKRKTRLNFFLNFFLNKTSQALAKNHFTLFNFFYSSFLKKGLFGLDFVKDIRNNFELNKNNFSVFFFDIFKKTLFFFKYYFKKRYKPSISWNLFFLSEILKKVKNVKIIFRGKNFNYIYKFLKRCQTKFIKLKYKFKKSKVKKKYVLNNFFLANKKQFNKFKKVYIKNRLFLGKRFFKLKGFSIFKFFNFFYNKVKKKPIKIMKKKFKYLYFFPLRKFNILNSKFINTSDNILFIFTSRLNRFLLKNKLNILSTDFFLLDFNKFRSRKLKKIDKYNNNKFRYKKRQRKKIHKKFVFYSLRNLHLYLHNIKTKKLTIKSIKRHIKTYYT